MTWDLAESGKEFITTIINKNDLVPSFGKASAAYLRMEVSRGPLVPTSISDEQNYETDFICMAASNLLQVMSSAWASELQEQIQSTRVFGFINRSVSFMQSHIPFMSDPTTPKVADADMFLPHTPMVR